MMSRSILQKIINEPLSFPLPSIACSKKTTIISILIHQNIIPHPQRVIVFTMNFIFPQRDVQSNSEKESQCKSVNPPLLFADAVSKKFKRILFQRFHPDPNLMRERVQIRTFSKSADLEKRLIFWKSI